MKLVKDICLLSFAATCAVTAQQQDPAIPVGSLSINQDLVRQGAKPVLTWDIEYPATVEDVVEIDEEDDEIVTKTQLRVEVSVIGVGITDQRGNEFPSRSFINLSSSGYHHVFTGTGSQVNPTTTYVDRVVPRGETIRFASRVNVSGFDFFFNESRNIVVLKNGDLPPSNAAGFQHQTSVADYLGPYVKNGRLSLGPMDIIYACELTHTDQNHFGYDLQDTIVLVRFTPVK